MKEKQYRYKLLFRQLNLKVFLHVLTTTMSSLNQPSQTNGPDDGPASASPDHSSDGPAAASSPKLSSYEVSAVQSS